MHSIKHLKLEGDKWFLRNKNFLYFNKIDNSIKKLFINEKIKINSILEIGCSNGSKLNQYAKLLKSKINYGVDISKLAIEDGKKKYKKINFLNISSLEIDQINKKFDLIICGFFLTYLDRDILFKQFDLIFNKLKKNGFLLILDFDPLFKHYNKLHHQKNLECHKVSYDNFLTESGLFEMMYKKKYSTKSSSKVKYKSNTISVTLFRVIDFKKFYPSNL